VPGSSQDPRKIVGTAIKRRRLARGFSQEQLAEAADLHWTYISGIERGIRNVSLLKLYRLAQALGIRVRDLVRDL